MKTHERLLEHLDPRKRMVDALGYLLLRTAPRIVCVDGFTMSVQAGDGIYCSPRDNGGHWYAFEIGYPSEKEDLIMEYAETPEDPTNTVYDYVPIDVVVAVIEKHGGMK